ncbi:MULTISPECIES: hypothetical protein [unclassified Chryseobacterium]|nr:MULTISPECIES: hypothetical protein [unclassified Chryseobacterium]
MKNKKSGNRSEVKKVESFLEEIQTYPRSRAGKLIKKTDSFMKFLKTEF